MIELTQVTKDYGRVRALKDVSFRAEKGRITGLLGRNGAGKTTALNIMTGYFPPRSGNVTVAGVNMRDDPRACKRKIGYLPERPPLYDEMTVTEYIRFACELKEVLPKEIGRHTEEIIRLCGLENMRDRLTGHLSRGYRQRTGIAQALCGSPDILLLDEPTAGLDPRQTADMRKLIKDLSRERTVIFSSHILSEVQQLCDDAVILKEGRVARVMNLDAGESELMRLKLTAAGAEKRLMPAIRGLGCVKTAEEMEGSGGGCTRVLLTCLRKDEKGRAEDQLFRLIVSLDAPIREMTEEKDSLEEIFLRDTEGTEDREETAQ